jgi:hypothetical protein
MAYFYIPRTHALSLALAIRKPAGWRVLIYQLWKAAQFCGVSPSGAASLAAASGLSVAAGAAAA